MRQEEVGLVQEVRRGRNVMYLFAPIFSMAEEGGPTNSTPSLLHSSAKILFSDKNP